MSTEQPTKPTLNIKIDRSEEMKDKDIKIENLIKENSKQQETIKILMQSEKEKFEKSTNHLGLKIPESGGESAPLETPKPKEVKLVSLEGVYIDNDMVFGRTPAEVIQKVETLAKSKAENADEYRRILSKIAKKALTSDKVLDLTYKGDSKLFLRHDAIIGEFDSDELRNRKIAYNKRLAENRVKFSQNS